MIFAETATGLVCTLLEMLADGSDSPVLNKQVPVYFAHRTLLVRPGDGEVTLSPVENTLVFPLKAAQL